MEENYLKYVQRREGVNWAGKTFLVGEDWLGYPRSTKMI